MTKLTVNNVKIEGADADVARLLEQMGVAIDNGDYYQSESHGLLKISDMNTVHIRNALLKRYQQWLNDARKIEDLDEFLDHLSNAYPNDTENLWNELESRVGNEYSID